MGHRKVLKFGLFPSHCGPDLPDLAKYSLIPLPKTHGRIYGTTFRYLHTSILDCGPYERGIEPLATQKRDN